MMTHDELVPLDVIEPMLTAATGDERWRDATATLIAGGKSNLTFDITSDAGSLILRRPPLGEPAAAGGHRPRGQGRHVSWLRRRLGPLRDETGSALVEFVFIALAVFMPLSPW